MFRQSISALAWVAAALFTLAASNHAAHGQAHPTTTPAPGHAAPGHLSPSDEAKMITETELGGGEGYPADPMRFEPALAFWTVIVFVGLIFVLTRFAWKPIMGALQAREEHFDHVLHETERARNESEALLAEHRRLMADASNQVKSLFEKARTDAQVSADQLLKTAQAEADSSRDRAKREIGVARDQALSEIWNKTADLAVSVAGKVLSKQIGDEDHRRLVENAIQELPEAAVSTNGHGGARV